MPCGELCWHGPRFPAHRWVLSYAGSGPQLPQCCFRAPLLYPSSMCHHTFAHPSMCKQNQHLVRLRRRPIHVPNPSARFNATPSVQPSAIPSDATTNVRRGEMQPSCRIHGRAHPLPRSNTAPCVQLPHDPCRLHHHLAARSNMMRPETCTSTAPHFPASTPSRCLLRHDPLPQQTWIDEITPVRKMSRRKCCLFVSNRA